VRRLSTPAPVSAGLNESDEAQPAQVLRDRGPRRATWAVRVFTSCSPLGEQAQQVQAGGVGQMTQHLRGQRELIA
jgi:hypothetical protein